MAEKNSLTFFSILLAICFIIGSEAQVNELTQGLSTFASQFYQKCAETEPGENIIVSPLSVSIALALLSEGAYGSTYDELKKGLHLSGNKTTTANQFHEYNAMLEKGAGKAILSVADQVYVQQGKEIEKQFRDVAVEKFSSGIEALNFANSINSARIINQFVENKTNNKIKNIVTPDSLDANTRIVLVNAIYFNGTWQNKFDKKQTYKEDFYTNDVDKQSTDFMHIKTRFNYAALTDLDATALEMNYAGSELSFVIILPNKRTGLSGLEFKLQNIDLSKIVGQMYSTQVDVAIPKFSANFGIKLNTVLKNLGMAKMFTAQADLSGLLEGCESLYVSEVIHKAFVEVNEAGTEAAAATAIIGARAAALPIARPDPIYFHAKQPFVFYIWDKMGKTAVFSGRLAKPN